MKMIPMLLIVFVGLAATGCATTQSWERGIHALGPMQVEDTGAQGIERTVDVYREGGVGANGGKSGGGCGCS
jgi:hypothetical protein